jgi:hypothetical protein
MIGDSVRTLKHVIIPHVSETYVTAPYRSLAVWRPTSRSGLGAPDGEGKHTLDVKLKALPP